MALIKQDLFNHNEITNLGDAGSCECDILSPVGFCRASNLDCIIFHKIINDTIQEKEIHINWNKN